MKLKYLTAEVYKIKSLKFLYFLYFFPVIILLIALFIFIKDINNIGLSPYNLFLNKFYLPFYTYFSPLVIALLTHTLIQNEDKNFGWRNMFLMPISKISIFISKISINILLVISYVIISLIFHTLILAILFLCSKEQNISNYIDFNLIGVLYSRFNSYFILLTLIYFPIFIYIKESLISIGLVFFLINLSFFILKNENIIYYPFAYWIIISKTSLQDHFLDKMMYINIAYCFFFLYYSWIIFKNKTYE